MATTIFQSFVYNEAHKVIVCRTCRTCIGARPEAQERHLRSQPHQLRGEALKAALALLSGYTLRSNEELQANKPAASTQHPAIEHLAIYRGWYCVQDTACGYATRSLRYMRLHAAKHGIQNGIQNGIQKARYHSSNQALWRPCNLQTYFTAGGRVDYFVVASDPTKADDGEGAASLQRRQLLLCRGKDESQSSDRGSGDGGGGDRGGDGDSNGDSSRVGDEEATFPSKLFDNFADDYELARRDLEAEACIVSSFGTSRSARIPWLELTGFTYHLAGLDDREIEASYKLPSTRSSGSSGSNGSNGSNDADEYCLRRILAAAHSLLYGAYELCNDSSPSCKMTRQRALILGDFYPAKGNIQILNKPTAFRPFKDTSTLARYVSTAKQMLAYFYRITRHGRGPFTQRTTTAAGSEAGQKKPTLLLPQAIVQPSLEQMRALADIEAILARGDSEGGEGGGRRQAEDDDDEEDSAGSPLCLAVERLLVALICHQVGSLPFKSPVVSFSAMLSRRSVLGRRSGRKRGGTAASTTTTRSTTAAAAAPVAGSWVNPGDFNSCLSALVWTAQLVLFSYACRQQQDDEDAIPVLLRDLCQRFFQQQAETPFGFILQWRLYLFQVSRSSVARHQAVWSLDSRSVTYQGLELELDQVSALARSEFERASALLYNELLFGSSAAAAAATAAGTAVVVPFAASQLRDDLDITDYGASWLTYPANAGLLAGADTALLSRICCDPGLKALFIVPPAVAGNSSGSSGGGRSGSSSSIAALSPAAVAVYEATVQDFLSALLVLCHITAGPPLRSPELLSVTWRNTARPRHIFAWEGLVMLHIQYHKGQQQTGAYRENARHLPRAVGELLLLYLAYVVPLRQLFLRRQAAAAARAKRKRGEDGRPLPLLLSPYLWSALDGTVWPDESLTRCLRSACARARVPQLNVSQWRQFAAAITKEKFSGAERANFDLDASGAVDGVEDEDEVVALAEMSNHGYRTFNHAYAGSTTLTLTVLLHRSRRASSSWHGLFGFDGVFFRDKLLQARSAAAAAAAAVAVAAGAGTGAGGSGEGAAASLRMFDDYYRSVYRPRPVFTEVELHAAASSLLGLRTGEFTFRSDDQRDAMLAVMGARAVEQVVLVLATGAGKTLLVMVSAAISRGMTTVFVLPTVAIRNDMLGRFAAVAITPVVWSPGEERSPQLLIVSAEAACSDSFLDYLQRLIYRQALARIIVDECHLTLTARSYRDVMEQLGPSIRRVRTQTVWLTATLPPAFERAFVEGNALVRPYILRRSTNRPNIYYSIRIAAKDKRSLVEQAATYLPHKWQSDPGFEPGRDKVILYCRTRSDVAALSQRLGCYSFTADSGTAEEKADIIGRWLADTDQPAIAATSALGPGLDYAYVRWVVHVGAPARLTDFAQESGRAGRDGAPARSYMLIDSTWQPSASSSSAFLSLLEADDRAAMDLYLSRQYCLRGVLAQFLDEPRDWRWCFGDDSACQVCGSVRYEPRPPGPRYELVAPSPRVVPPLLPPPLLPRREQGAVITDEMVFTGPAEVRRRALESAEFLESYERGLRALVGQCLYCRACVRPFDHVAGSCTYRWDWINAKKRVLDSVRRQQGRGSWSCSWIADYLVCFTCYQPQGICRRADPAAAAAAAASEGARCRYADMVLPLCYGAWVRPDRDQWLSRKFAVSFAGELEYMLWLGTEKSFRGSRLIAANYVAAAFIDEMR